VSGAEQSGVAAVRDELRSRPLVHGPTGESTRASAAYPDGLLGCWAALVEPALEESLDER
jgi:hypothetical protein